MARTDTLPHFLTDVADAIRTKTGESGTIQASDFDTAIENLPSGGGGQIWYTSNLYGSDGRSTSLTVNVSSYASGFPLNNITPKKGLVVMFTRSDYTVSNNVEVIAETDFLTATDETKQKLIVGWCEDFTQNIVLTQESSNRLAIGGMFLQFCEKPTSSDVLINTTSNASSITVNSTDNLCVYFTTGAFYVHPGTNSIDATQFYNIDYNAPSRLACFITGYSGNKTIPFDGNGSAIIGIELKHSNTR